MATTRRVITKAERDGFIGKECVKLEVAAEYLECSQGTLKNWISARKFTAADGLRRVGGMSRVHFPTLRARFVEGTLMEVADK